MRARIKPRIRLENRPKLEKLIPLSTPLIINVDPADICNFQCVFCPTGDRELMRKTPGRFHGLMDFDLFKKIIDDILEFEHPLKVLRLYKDGEPLLHPRFPDMVSYAKESGCAEVIDTTTNASRLSPKLNMRIIEAGLDRINISLYGINEAQYRNFSKAKVDFQKIVANIHHFYEHSRGKCVVHVKINGDIIPEKDREQFFVLFGDIADEVYVEHIMSCWPNFELESKGVHANLEAGIYGQPIKEVAVCPYIFYSFSINSNGTASACFLDWAQKLIIGNARDESMKNIWHGTQLLAHQRMMLLRQRKQHPVCGDCDQLRRGLPDDIDRYASELLKRLSSE